MAHYVLVPGACHGSWCFDSLVDGLSSHGHRVRALTLTGVAERAHLRHSGVNLDTHIADVVATLDADSDGEADAVVLVGHSYGGMVITAVADQSPNRVSALIYLDAVVPRDRESCWDLVDDELRNWYLDVDDTGYGVPPLPFFDPRATAHPLASLLQRARLTGAVERVARREYVAALGWPGDSPLRRSFERVRDNPAWNTHELNGGHNLMRDNPEDLLRIVLAAGDTPSNNPQHN